METELVFEPDSQTVTNHNMMVKAWIPTLCIRLSAIPFATHQQTHAHIQYAFMATHISTYSHKRTHTHVLISLMRAR